MLPSQLLWIRAIPLGGVTGSQCFSGFFSFPLPGEAAPVSRAYPEMGWVLRTWDVQLVKYTVSSAQVVPP